MDAEGVDLAVFIDYFCSFISSSGGAGPLEDFLFLPDFQNCEIKNTGLK